MLLIELCLTVVYKRADLAPTSKCQKAQFRTRAHWHFGLGEVSPFALDLFSFALDPFFLIPAMLAPTSRRHWAATYIPLCLLLILAFNLLPQSDPDSRHGVDVFRGIKHALNPSEASIYAMPATYSTIEEHNEAKSTDTLASKMTALYENLAETANRTLGVSLLSCQACRRQILTRAPSSLRRSLP